MTGAAGRRVRRRELDRHRALAEARGVLVAGLQRVLGPAVDGPSAQVLLEQAQAWTPAVARELARHFAEHPDPLTAPSPHCPAALVRLLRHLAAAGHGDAVTHLGCAVCGRTDQMLHRLTEQGRCCRWCVNGSDLKRCARCGQDGRLVARREDGSICRGCYRVESREECAACGRSRPPCTWREDGSALCQGCAPPPAQICVHCGRLAVPKVTRAHGPVCRSCYEQPKRACGQCGRTSEIRARSAGDGTDLCQNCYRRRRADTCTVCGRLRPGDRIGSTTFRCHSCRPRPTGRCCDCGRTRTVAATWPMGPLCGACHLRRRRNPRPCSRCGQTRVLAGRTDGHDLCGPCCGAQQLHFACRRCGFPGDIYTDGCCTRCVTRDRLEDLLSVQDGAVRPLFTPLIDALCAAKQPGSVLVWARGGPASRMLATLSAEEKPPTHASLDALPQNQTTRYLRALLVATAVLPWRNENFARLEHWLSKTAGPLPPHQARIIRPFAEWSILRDARRRAARGPYTAGAAAVDRGHIRAAISFLTWIDTQNLTLATLPQEHFDLWLTTHPTLHQPVRPFIQWAHARRVAGPLALQRKPKGLPSLFLTEQEQHEQLRRCLNDTALPLEIRIIGSFIRLYAQQVSKVVEFTTDRFHQDSTGAYFTFGSNPVLLPPKLARLIEQQIAQPALSSAVPPHSTERPVFLFPGRPSGHPRSASSAQTLLRAHGLPNLTARNTAMIEAVTDLPPIVVSDLFGIAAGTAHSWAQLANDSWTDYLAACAATRQRTEP